MARQITQKDYNNIGKCCNVVNEDFNKEGYDFSNDDVFLIQDVGFTNSILPGEGYIKYYELRLIEKKDNRNDEIQPNDVITVNANMIANIHVCNAPAAAAVPFAPGAGAAAAAVNNKKNKNNNLRGQGAIPPNQKAIAYMQNIVMKGGIKKHKKSRKARKASKKTRKH